MILQVLDVAQREIEAAQDYLDLQSEHLGDRFYQDLANTFADITRSPGGFPKLETLPDSSPYRRALLSVFSYAVIFEIMNDVVIVVAVPHTSREPNYWLGRKK